VFFWVVGWVFVLGQREKQQGVAGGEHSARSGAKECSHHTHQTRVCSIKINATHVFQINTNPMNVLVGARAQGPLAIIICPCRTYNSNRATHAKPQKTQSKHND
jgi:hypothetical protein